MQRIGVFVCHCGTNIAGTVDVKAVASALEHEPGVVFSTDYQYMCCLLYTSPSPRDPKTSRMPSSA